ncbi:hypothetical protein N7540_004096 [Penicillium herquei]|nr:hypothetical protein N7540_004096 [Penicillium herquei]
MPTDALLEEAVHSDPQKLGRLLNKAELSDEQVYLLIKTVSHADDIKPSCAAAMIKVLLVKEQ